MATIAAESGSAPVADHKDILASQGPAVGRIRRVNHIQIVALDMDETVRFYRDLLGFTVIRTLGEDYVPVGTQSRPAWPVPHQIFVQLPDGCCLTFIEVKGAKPAQHSIWTPSFWPGEYVSPDRPEKMDHLAFDVETYDELVWFRDHLRANGVATSEILSRRETVRFVDSLYFKDPSGIPLELATWNLSHPSWNDHRAEDWLMDTKPVPSLSKGG